MASDPLLAADRVVLLVDPGSRDSVLDAAARLLTDGAPELTPAVAAALRTREHMASTGIGHGVAIPHCRSRAYGEARGAFLRLAYPVDFSSADGEPVDLVYAMCVPEHDARQHLQTMAELAGRFADPAFRDSLRQASDLAALRQALISPADSAVWSITSA